MKHAVIPGSFDPVTVGHLDLITRAARLFDRVTVLVMQNPYKSSCVFTVEQRLEMLRRAVAALPGVSLDTDGALLADYCASHHATLVKGVRDVSDFAYESSMAHINYSLSGVETVLLTADPSVSFVSSTMVRELLRCGRDPSPYMPEGTASLCLSFYNANRM